MIVHAAVDNDIHPPRFGGAQRSFGLARGLARRHRVRVLCVVPNRTEAPEHETVEGVELIRRKAWHTSVAWRLEQWRLAPMFWASGGHRANAARYRAALGSGADVLATDLNMSALLDDPAPRLRVYTSQNVEADRFRDSAPPVLARGAWARRLDALERRAVTRADLVVTCTDEDAARMRERYGVGAERVAVVPNGYDEHEFAPVTRAARARARAELGLSEGDYVAAFLGADWGPNREALATLIERVMPPLAAEGFRLLVLGSVARALTGARPAWVRAPQLSGSPAPLLAAADAGLNPVRSGGGSNVKLPSYLGMGLAVVTTPFGLRGFADLASEVVVADEDGFADALRTRPRGRAARGDAAPAALAGHAWGHLGERLGGIYEGRLGRAGARGAA